MAVKLTKDNFNEMVLNSDKPVLVDFWATWCGPCQMISPIIEQLSQENTSFTVSKVNVDEEPELATKFGITAIPTLLVFKNGKLAAQKVGFISKPEIEAMLK